MPVTAVYITKRDEEGVDTNITDGSTLTLREGRMAGIGCMTVINGSLVDPTVTVTIGQTDETRLFTPESK